MKVLSAKDLRFLLHAYWNVSKYKMNYIKFILLVTTDDKKSYEKHCLLDIG